MNTVPLITAIAGKARKAGLALQNAPAEHIDRALVRMAKRLGAARLSIQAANKKDLRVARTKGFSPALLDRLTLSDKTIAAMIRGLLEIAALRSPLGIEYDRRRRPNGLVISKVRVPIGVIAIIYESRPNVTVDAAALCLKSGNAVILRGGSESLHSNIALAELFRDALVETGLPADAVQVVPTADRSAVRHLLTRSEEIDLVIPRGGEGLIRMVAEISLIPVIKHYKGVCHVYVSRHADMRKALPIVVNAKVQRPSVCNAMETLLLDEKMSLKSRKKIIGALLEKNVVLFGDSASRTLADGMKKATIDDWKAEYLDLRLAVRTVRGVHQAIDHINTYGSHHTDAIVTESAAEADAFVQGVDSSSVMVNASTRFADGGEYGMGCEIGISTDKLHARGPMGIDELTTYKWIVRGTGQTRK
ncbi:MAG: glutamate-5-semialdehyde dehydrogenase [Chitinispirillaceae bacterium]|nr:glutamate-5-semialdehyde dehydrogenase [Chitinispirillaceae bacterium]